MILRIFKSHLTRNKNLIKSKNFQKRVQRTIVTSNQVHSNHLLSGSPDLNIPNVNLAEYLFPKLEAFEKYTAAVCATTGRSFTFGQVRVKSKNLSKALRHIFKLRKGDAVAFFSSNKSESAIVMLGLLDAGLPITTLNPVYTPAEISRQLLDCSTKLIITQSQSINTVKAALELSNKNIPIIGIKSKQSESLPAGVIDFEEMVNLNFDIPDVDVAPSDLAFLPYSSGTTGLPKGVKLSHSNIVSNLCQLNHSEYNYYDEPSDSHQDVIPAVLPFFHIYGLVLIILTSLQNGSKNVVMNRFSPELYVSVLKNNPVSIIYAVPPLVLFLTSSPLVKSEYFQHLKLLMSGAAPLGHLDEQKMLKKINNPKTKIVQAYGLTETSPIITYFPKHLEKNEQNGGSIGVPIPNTVVKIIATDDNTGTPLGPFKNGEILVKGPQVMMGYHNRDEETKNSFLDGWLRTGDIAYYDEKGLLFITDRIKELIKVKGFQVAPAELEEILRDHPLIEDAAVVGIPHEQYGEVPKAFVVPKTESTLNTEDVKNHVAQKVAKYKELAGGIQIVDQIPRNPSGKILRRQLKLQSQISS